MSDDVKFGRVCFCGFISPDGRVLWCTEKTLFRKIVSSKSVIKALESEKAPDGSFEHRFMFGGIRYMLRFIKVPEELYFCTAYPEDRFIKHSYSDMYSVIHGIKLSAVEMLSSLDTFIREMTEDEFADKYYLRVQDQRKLAESIFSDSSNILRLFDSGHMNEYVPIVDNLEFAYTQVHKYNIPLRRDISFSLDIGLPVANINLAVLELALFGIVRMLYLVMEPDSSAVISVTGDKDGSLRFGAGYTAAKDIDCDVIAADMRLVKCSFEDLGGNASITLNGREFSVSAIAPASLSNYTNRIKPENLTPGGIGDPARVFGNIDRILSPQRDGEIGRELVFSSNMPEVEVNFTFLLADIMFTQLVEQFSREN